MIPYVFYYDLYYDLYSVHECHKFIKILINPVKPLVN